MSRKYWLMPKTREAILMRITNDKVATAKKRIPILSGPNEHSLIQCVSFKESKNPLGYAFFETNGGTVRTKLSSVQKIEPYVLSFTGELLDTKDNTVGQIEGTYNCALKTGLMLTD